MQTHISVDQAVSHATLTALHGVTRSLKHVRKAETSPFLGTPSVVTQRLRNGTGARAAAGERTGLPLPVLTGPCGVISSGEPIIAIIIQRCEIPSLLPDSINLSCPSVSKLSPKTSNCKIPHAEPVSSRDNQFPIHFLYNYSYYMSSFPQSRRGKDGREMKDESFQAAISNFKLV